MPIDPSIILGIKPVQLPQADPLEQYGKSLTLQHLLQQGKLGELQYKQAQQAMTADERIRALFSTNPNATSAEVMGIDPTKGLALRKAEQESETHRSTIAKNNADVVTKTVAQYRDQLANVNDPQSAAQWVSAQYSDPTLKDVVSRMGPMEQAIANIPQEPQAFQQWRQQQALGMTKFTELNKPHVTTQNLGGTERMVATPGLGGTPTVLSETAKTMTPGEIASNQVARGNLAVAQGNLGLSRERLNFDRSQPRGQYDADRGLLIDPRTGEARPVTQGGEPVGPKDKPLTESQGKAAGMLHRATAANDVLNKLEDSGVRNRGIIKQAAGAVPVVGGGLEMGVNTLPGFMGGPSSQQQQVEQARRDFVNAALRVESGASISHSEFANAERQYFPMPGDSKETIALKRKSRETELEGLRLQAGPSKAAIAIRPALAEAATPTRADIDAELRRRGVIR